MWQPLLLGIIGITTATTALALQDPAASAQDASSVERIAKAITVRIEGATQGSGVVVKKEGNRYTVLTAWHVINSNNDGEELNILMSNNSNHSIRVNRGVNINRVKELDLAQIHFESSEDYPVSILSKKVQHGSGSDIFVQGYPLETNKAVLEYGRVLAHAEIGIDQGYQLLYSSKTKPGMSGGPLLDNKGEIIGIHGRGEQDIRLASYKKTGINQGIPISHYENYLRGDSAPKLSASPTSYDDYYAMTVNSLRIDQPQTAIRLTGQMELGFKDKLDTHLLSQIAYRNLGDKSTANQERKKSISIVKKYQEMLKKSWDLVSRDPKKAIDIANQARQISKINYLDTDFIKAWAYDSLDNTEKTILYARRVVESSNNSNNCSILVDCTSEAVRSLMRSNMYWFMAKAQRKLGNYSQVIQSYKSAIDNAPSDSLRAKGSFLLAKAYLKINKNDAKNACYYFQKAIENGLKNIIQVDEDFIELCQAREKEEDKLIIKIRETLNGMGKAIPYKKPPFPKPIANDWSTKDRNLGFKTLTVIRVWSDESGYDVFNQKYPYYIEQGDELKRVMIHVPSIKKQGDWYQAYVVAYADYKHGIISHGFNSYEFNNNRMHINCKTGAINYTSHGKHNHLLSESLPGHPFVVRPNNWWLTNYQIARIMMAKDSSEIIGKSTALWTRQADNQEKSAIFDYLCPSSKIFN
ncbi:serine protease [Synechococcus sp. AH-603-L18]|nr:serine protease [Synechococcus sp. AH-603-L18]MDB4338140.1 serine protease [Synechococcus sp. AH-603-L18]